MSSSTGTLEERGRDGQDQGPRTHPQPRPGSPSSCCHLKGPRPWVSAGELPRHRDGSVPSHHCPAEAQHSHKQARSQEQPLMGSRPDNPAPPQASGSGQVRRGRFKGHRGQGGQECPDPRSQEGVRGCLYSHQPAAVWTGAHTGFGLQTPGAQAPCPLAPDLATSPGWSQGHARTKLPARLVLCPLCFLGDKAWLYPSGTWPMG